VGAVRGWGGLASGGGGEGGGRDGGGARGGGGGFFFFFLVAGLVNLTLAIRRCLTLLWAALIRYGLQLWCDNFEDCVSEFLRLFPPEPS